jgi:hypothetical protein
MRVPLALRDGRIGLRPSTVAGESVAFAQMKRMGLALTALALTLVFSPAASATTVSARSCGPFLTVHGVSCAQAQTVMSAWMNSYDGSSPARFRYGVRTWACDDVGKPQHGRQLWRCVSRHIWFRSLWPANYNQRNDTCSSPELADGFDGGTFTDLTVVDFAHTPGVGCGYASGLFTSLYDRDEMLAANGTATYTDGPRRWRCSTDGVAGNASDNWYSDVDLNCTSLPTALTNLQQWLSFDVGMLPVVACTGNTEYGPAVSCPLFPDDVLDDSDLNDYQGYQSAGMKMEDFSDCQPDAPECSGGNMLVPIVGATDHYALCIWEDAGPVDDNGTTEEGYTCTFSGTPLPAT